MGGVRDLSGFSRVKFASILRSNGVRFVESSRQCLGMAGFRVETSLWGGWGVTRGSVEGGISSS